MSDTNTNRPISPEVVASKLAAVRNFEHPEITAEIEAEPRLVEVLLFLQFVSQPENYAGGLRKFTADLIADSLDLIGTAEMQCAGECKLTIAQAKKIYGELPGWAKSRVGGYDDEAYRSFDIEDILEDVGRFNSSLVDRLQRKSAKEAATADGEERLRKLLTGSPWTVFHDLCVSQANDKLSAYLRALCEVAAIPFKRVAFGREYESGAGAPWYFVEVSKAVLRWIDRRKAEIAATIAETEVTRLVFKWLGKARSTSRAVLISGNSRFGKTEALRTWCAMNPGLARLVNTPASNSEGELLREVAKALGLEIGPTSTASRLRDRIDHVLRHTRLMLVIDEAHMCFPLNFSRNTAPARLNWVRRSVMDAGLPCAFCSTPQSYNSAQQRYVKTTGYAIEQFTGRLLKTVELPEELSREDLLAVARIHFPKLAEIYLQYVVAVTLATERNYVSDLEKIATLARDNAQEGGRKLPTLEDIKSAIADVLPPAVRPAPALPNADAAPRFVESEETVLQPSSRARARKLNGPCKAGSRGMQPTPDAALSAAGGRITFGAESPAELTHADGD